MTKESGVSFVVMSSLGKVINKLCDATIDQLTYLSVMNKVYVIPLRFLLSQIGSLEGLTLKVETIDATSS